MSSLYNFKYDEGGNTLFFGSASTFDTVNRRYPQLFDIYKELKKRDWSETDVPLAGSYRDLQQAPKSKYELMSKTLTWQLEGDSLIARADAVLFAPFVSNSEYSQLLAYIMQGENLHALTYSEIIKQCYDTPMDIFHEIEKNKQIQDRSGMIISTLERLERVGAMYRLDKNSISQAEVDDAVFRGAVAVYCLEKISFMSSFAITFALAENQFCMEIARLVQKIYIDESFHAKGRATVLGIMYNEEGAYWRPVFERNKEWAKLFIDSVVKQEHEWSEYIFSEGRQIVGLNAKILQNFTDFSAQEVYSVCKVNDKSLINENPIPYMDSWLDIDNIQLANQETQNANYLLNSQVDDAGSDVIDFNF